MASTKLSAGRKINLAMASAATVALGVSGVLVVQLVSKDQSARSGQMKMQSQATVTTDPQTSESKSYTKVDTGSEKLVKGTTVLSMSGQSNRVSHVDDFNFDWTGVWSADCQDSASASVFKVDFISISSSGSQSAVVVDKEVNSGEFASGTFDGLAVSSGQLKIESNCDWSISVVKVS
ncbi:MAG: hypothetical protein M0019_00100 [Actinomycetota bacterium]|nr:hypothetical protein [Actinomycetota bacterium]